jgi:hypothetical protein
MTVQYQLQYQYYKTMTLANIALAWSINYNHRVLCKLRHILQSELCALQL